MYCTVRVCLVLWEAAKLSSKATVAFWTPSESNESSCGSSSSSALGMVTKHHSKCVQWYLIDVLVCIPLMKYDVERLSMCLFVVHVSSLVTCLLSSLAHFLTFFYSWVLRIPYVWITVFYYMCLLQIFNPRLWLLSHSLNIVFHRA